VSRGQLEQSRFWRLINALDIDARRGQSEQSRWTRLASSLGIDVNSWHPEHPSAVNNSSSCNVLLARAWQIRHISVCERMRGAMYARVFLRQTKLLRSHRLSDFLQQLSHLVASLCHHTRRFVRMAPPNTRSAFKVVQRLLSRLEQTRTRTDAVQTWPIERLSSLLVPWLPTRLRVRP
jgi:hypothetical protein